MFDKLFFKDSLVRYFSYHDGEIIEFKKIKNDFLLKFKDGWLDDQVNEILFVDCIISFDSKFSCQEIYQFEDLSYNENDGFTMILDVIPSDPMAPLECFISFKCKNIVSKMYENSVLVKKENLLEFLENN